MIVIVDLHDLRAVRAVDRAVRRGAAVRKGLCAVEVRDRLAVGRLVQGRAVDPGDRSQFWLGTDQLGRDMLSRLIFGARNTIGIALATALLSFLIGGTLGMLAGYLRGWFDQVLSRAGRRADVDPDADLRAAAAVDRAGALRPEYQTSMMIIIIAALDSTRVFRLSRAAHHERRGDGLRRSGAACGAKRSRWIIFREILPNIAPPLILEFGLRFCFVFLTICVARLPRRRHPAADGRLGLDGRRERDADHLRQHHAAAAGRRHRAADGRGQFRRRLVPAQDERAEG